jgi:hypothetical protein
MANRWFCPICTTPYTEPGNCINLVHFAICSKCDLIQMVRRPWAMSWKHKKCGGRIQTYPQQCGSILVQEGTLVSQDQIIQIMTSYTERARRNIRIELDETHHRWLRNMVFILLLSIGIILLVCGALALRQPLIPY